jgi:hypothetical protein
LLYVSVPLLTAVKEESSNGTRCLALLPIWGRQLLTKLKHRKCLVPGGSCFTTHIAHTQKILVMDFGSENLAHILAIRLVEVDLNYG